MNGDINGSIKAQKRLFHYNWQWRRPVVRIPLLVNLLVCAPLQSAQIK
ncbi:hypothetical protein T4A_12049 [Trichinella pseudospiralis]|uniref:Uncharacterized protein n=1 Tax=Trichinella pseudospiralis TaxID=6337 RepID=A0A0V1GMJ4_TRIPS|nr:hypothetical protein T4A_12049 [Trichinella pseudospiralis]KRY99461.1 hypothetical protein T4C_7169 [Trichinella pseudospiralis]